MLSRYSECREAGSEIVLVEDRSGIARRTDILEAFSGLPASVSQATCPLLTWKRSCASGPA